jgi:hypothetical protein
MRYIGKYAPPPTEGGEGNIGRCHFGDTYKKGEEKIGKSK